MNTILKIISIILIFFWSNILFAQINDGSLPLSFEKRYTFQEEIPTIKMAKINIAKLRLEDEKNDLKKDKPWRFGKKISVNIDVKNKAISDTIKGVGIIWRLKIKSENAKTLNFVFDEYKLPEKAKLHIYNSAKNDILGGFTSFNNQNDNYFATSLLKGDEAIIEYFEPFDAEFSGKLHISHVTHGYRTAYDFSKSFGDSGACNINVACSEGDEWQNEIRSVLMLMSNNSGFCTGTLINNVVEDETPYILTAQHCSCNASTLVVAFNWESETCENPSLVPSHNDISGATHIAENSKSDFCLFQLNQTPPTDYNVYYAGWDKTGEPSPETTGIHHPNGDIKKISIDNDACISSDYDPWAYLPDSHWKIESWNKGTTEAGSSGSPLFDVNHRVIGQLHGGWAACGNQDADYYGKFSLSWDNSDYPSQRLKDWLDPFNENPDFINGFDPNMIQYDVDLQIIQVYSPKKNYYKKEKIAPTIYVKNKGNYPVHSFVVKYSIDNQAFVEKTWSGVLRTNKFTKFKFDSINTDFGNHTIKFIVEKPNDSIDENQSNNSVEFDYYVYQEIFSDNFDNGNFWTLKGEFEIAKPEAQGGSYGNPDPENAFSGDYVLGTDLSGLGELTGDYEKNLRGSEYSATSPMIDCRAYNNVKLNFRKWLNIGGYSDGDNAKIEIFSDTAWHKIWQNPNAENLEDEWSEKTLSISEYADYKQIKIRFSLGSTDDTIQFSGWNIDDFLISGNLDNDKIADMKYNNFDVFPNPSKNNISVNVNNEIIENSATVEITDILGKAVFRKIYKNNEILQIENIAGKRNVINVEHNIKVHGIYIISVSYNNKKQSKLIVIEK